MSFTVKMSRPRFLDICLAFYTKLLLERKDRHIGFLSKQEYFDWCEKHGPSIQECKDLYKTHKHILKTEGRSKEKVTIEIKNKELYDFIKTQNQWR